VSSQVNLTRKGAAGLAELRAIMARLRENPPWRVGEHDVAAVRDYQQQVATTKDGKTSALVLPKSDVLAFELASAGGRGAAPPGCRIIARPSGTEPKAKFYFDVREPMRDGETLAAAQARAGVVMKALADAFVALAVPSS
jgi:phosphomannomutase